jgi:organic hydroperoxide reductase OsmC/OhrA
VKTHNYKIAMRWTGNDGRGTQSYTSYRRDHIVKGEGKPEIPGSSEPAFRGDPSRYNPEELLVSTLSSCHMLWYLHLCAVNGIVVTEYSDEATGTMNQDAEGSGQLQEVTLHPKVKIDSGDPVKAESLHHEAHRLCNIARSVNFPVHCESTLL